VGGAVWGWGSMGMEQQGVEQHGDGSMGVGSMGSGVAWGVGQHGDEDRVAWGWDNRG